MKRRSLLALMGTSVMLTGCFGKRYVWRQKITVTVGTPDGEKSGSAVTEITAKVGGQPILAQGAIVGYGIRGEATVVDLGHGKYLFALLTNLRGPTPEYIVSRVYGQRFLDMKLTGEDQLSDFYSKIVVLRETTELEPWQMPLLVTFTDIDNPRTIKLVNQGNIKSLFGAEYAIKTITFELTDEAPTPTVSALKTRWLSDPNPIFIDFYSYPVDHPLQSVNKTSFVRKQ